MKASMSYLGLGPVCVVSPNFHAHNGNGWECSDWPLSELGLRTWDPCEPALISQRCSIFVMGVGAASSLVHRDLSLLSASSLIMLSLVILTSLADNAWEIECIFRKHGRPMVYLGGIPYRLWKASLWFLHTAVRRPQRKYIRTDRFPLDV